MNNTTRSPRVSAEALCEGGCIERYADKGSFMLAHLRRAFTFLVAPPTCAFCKIFITDDTVVCDECRSRIMPIVSHEITVTQKYSMKVIAVSPYQDPLRSLILAKNRSSLVASTQLGMLIWQMSTIKTVPVDCFIPIPLHWTRFAKRGFNQAHEIARVLSEQPGKPVMPVLKRVKRTQFQAALAHDERSENVADAFSFCGKPEQITGKHIVLVDDLMTTGSTLKVAARQLTDLKPASLTAVVACRVV